MNIDRDNRVHAEPPNIFQRPANQPQTVNLSPEELKEWRNCVQWGFVKFGVPFALSMHVLSSFLKKEGKLQFTPSNIPALVINTVIGGFFYAPSCYKKLQAAFANSQQKMLQKEQEGVTGLKSEGGDLQTDDINFQSKLDTNFEASESNFSHLDLDLGSSYSDNLVLEDVQDEKGSQQNLPTTTYEDLRKRNRETYVKSPTLFPSARHDNRDPGPVTQKAEKEPPPKKVVKNKYGDEMES